MCQPSSSYLSVSACYTTNDGRVAPLAVPFPRTNESESLYGGDRRRRRRKTVAARWPRPCLGLTPSRLRRHLLPPPTGTPANERVRSPAASTMTPFSRARGFGCSSAPGRAWITTGRTEPFLHDSSDRPTSCAVIEFFFLVLNDCRRSEQMGGGGNGQRESSAGISPPRVFFFLSRDAFYLLPP